MPSPPSLFCSRAATLVPHPRLVAHAFTLHGDERQVHPVACGDAATPADPQGRAQASGEQGASARVLFLSTSRADRGLAPVHSSAPTASGTVSSQFSYTCAAVSATRLLCLSATPPRPRLRFLRSSLSAVVIPPKAFADSRCSRSVDPRWASTNLGVFVCIRCSGIHRSLGVHISRIKSIDLDTWTPEQVANVQRWGNKRANVYWEKHLKPGHVPPDQSVHAA